MLSKEELKKVYESLNDSEKHGVQFGLFPAKLGLSSEECSDLMKVRMESEKYDVNKGGEFCDIYNR